MSALQCELNLHCLQFGLNRIKPHLSSSILCYHARMFASYNYFVKQSLKMTHSIPVFKKDHAVNHSHNIIVYIILISIIIYAYTFVFFTL